MRTRSKPLATVRDRLIDFLDKTDVNLLVLGRSNRPGGFKTWALGTVPMYAVQHGKGRGEGGRIVGGENNHHEGRAVRSSVHTIQRLRLSNK
jgi:hypothetical protein